MIDFRAAGALFYISLEMLSVITRIPSINALFMLILLADLALVVLLMFQIV
jgi:hypothetical protein